MPDPNFHFVLRVSPTVRIEGRNVSVVEEHKAVSESRGCVAVGKFGAFPRTALRVLERQLGAGGDADLYLVHRQGVAFRAHSAPLCWVGQRNLPERYRGAIPDYYKKLAEEPCAWFVVCAPLRGVELANLRLASNGRELNKVLSESSAAFMLVTRSTGARGRDSQ